MTMHWLPQAELQDVLADERPGLAYGPAVTSRLAWIDALDPGACVEALAQPRPGQSPKGFFMPAAESLGRYGAAAPAATQTQTLTEPVILVGVRACELRARNYLDKVMLGGEYTDERYRRRRETTTIISCDCADCTESCFCTAVGGLPYPTEGYDVNLSPAGDGYVVDVATDRGRQWLGDRAAGLAEATPEQLARRDQFRQAMVERVTRQNEAFALNASDAAAPEPVSYTHLRAHET